MFDDPEKNQGLKNLSDLRNHWKKVALNPGLALTTNVKVVMVEIDKQERERR